MKQINPDKDAIQAARESVKYRPYDCIVNESSSRLIPILWDFLIVYNRSSNEIIQVIAIYPPNGPGFSNEPVIWKKALGLASHPRICPIANIACIVPDRQEATNMMFNCNV